MKKLILSTLFLLSISTNSYSFDDFLKQPILLSEEEKITIQVEQSMRNILSQYNKDKNSNIKYVMLRVGDKTERDFLDNVNGKANYEDDFFSVIFLNDIKVNNLPSSTCFALTSNKDWSSNLKLYLNYFKNIDSLISYFSLHEVAHCLSKAENIELNDFNEEAFADIFATINLIEFGELNTVQSIVDITQNSTDDKHKTYQIIKSLLKNKSSLKQNLTLNQKINLAKTIILSLDKQAKK